MNHAASRLLLAVVVSCAPPAAEPVKPAREVRSEVPGLLFCGNLPPDRPPTHPPILWRNASTNMFLVRGDSTTGPPVTIGLDWPPFIAAQLEDRPRLVGPGTFAGENIMFVHMGPLKGLPYYGNTTANGTPYDLYGGSDGGPDEYALNGLPSEQLLLTRKDRHYEYIQEYGDILAYSYLDFSTQFFGNHRLRRGFWEFWDNVDDYPNMLQPPPNLGDPYDWLRRKQDNSPQTPAYGLNAQQEMDLEGLSFDYSPIPDGIGDFYRYHVNITSAGWEWWWPQAVRWNAEAGYRLQYFDNVWFRNCFNDECLSAYLDWLNSNYTPQETARLHTETTSYMGDHSFEGNWFEQPNGWQHSFFSGATPTAIVPDIDAYHGLYSARIAEPGISVWSEAIPPASKLPGHYRMTIHYKMEPGVVIEAEARAEYPNSPPIFYSAPGGPALPFSETWTHAEIEFPLSTGAKVQIFFNTSGGTAWIDDLWLTDVQNIGGQEILTHPQFRVDLKERWSNVSQFYELLVKTSVTFWDSLVDDRTYLLREAGRAVEPSFDLFLSTGGVQRRNAGYYMLDRKALSAEWLRVDVGHAPGYYGQGGMLQDIPILLPLTNSNIFDFKYAYSHRFNDEFAYLMHLVNGGGVFYAHNPDSALLNHAEVAAYGGGGGFDLMLYANPYYYDPHQFAALRQVDREFLKFV